MPENLTSTVKVNGQTVARFAYSADAVFFASMANAAKLFTFTDPGHTVQAFDWNGELIEPVAEPAAT